MTHRWPTVLFDLDGTLANTIPLIVASYQHAFRTVLGEEIDETRARAWIGRPLLDALLEEYPEHGHAMDAVYREWNLANHDRLLEPYEGVDSLLRDLRAARVTTAVVTSKRRQTAEMALRGTGLTELIDVVATLESTATHKPGPEPLTYGAGVVGVQPSECAYVGDAAVDVLAAKAAGMAAVAVTWGAGTREALVGAGADHVCDTLEELRTLLLP